MKIVMNDAAKVDGAGNLKQPGEIVEVSDAEGRALIAEGRARQHVEAAKAEEAAPPAEDAAKAEEIAPAAAALAAKPGRR
jgi:hypothetical protein